MEARSSPFSQTLPSLGSRSAIMRRKRLLPDPDGPVMAAHAPAPRVRSNGPANSLRSSFTRSAVSIEFPCFQWPCLRSPKFPHPITTIPILDAAPCAVRWHRPGIENALPDRCSEERLFLRAIADIERMCRRHALPVRPWRAPYLHKIRELLLPQ